MAKTIKQEGEATKVAIRLARKTVMEQIRKLTSKDAQRLEEKRVRVPGPCRPGTRPVTVQVLSLSCVCDGVVWLLQVQKITDDFIRDVGAMCESKEQQLQSIS